MGEEHRIVIPGIQDRVPDVCDFVVAAARRAGLNERAVYHCQMAVDEACTNIIEHGFGTADTVGEIEVLCQDTETTYVIRITDDSPPFNPLARSDPNPDTPLHEREPGGWGIYFIKKMMDDAQYSLEDSRNVLTIVKHKTENNVIRPRQTADDNVGLRKLGEHIWQITPMQRLESNTAPQLQSVLETQLDAGHDCLIIDMSQIAYISTSGLKVLVGAWRRARTTQGNVALAGMNTHIFEVFETVGFDQVFDIYPTVLEALEHMGDRHTT
jgi:serine/threonine-protein kinase RsbW